MSIRSFFRGLFGSSEKAVEVSTPVVVVEEKVAPKEIDAEKAKAAIEQRLKEISEEKKSEEKKALARIMAEQDAERARLKKEADDAAAIAKEKQRQEMVGWIVKALLAVGIIILIPGFLLKSPSFILSGIGMLGLAFVAATIPFWVVSTIMGIFMLVLIVVVPKTGKVDFTPWNKTDEVKSMPKSRARKKAS